MQWLELLFGEGSDVVKMLLIAAAFIQNNWLKQILTFISAMHGFSRTVCPFCLESVTFSIYFYFADCQ